MVTPERKKASKIQIIDQISVTCFHMVTGYKFWMLEWPDHLKGAATSDYSNSTSLKVSIDNAKPSLLPIPSVSICMAGFKLPNVQEENILTAWQTPVSVRALIGWLQVRGCMFKSWIFSSFTYFSNKLCAVKLRV